MGHKHDHFARKLKTKLLKGFKIQFTFRVKPRTYRYKYLDKSVYGDEYVSILNFKYNIITCKNCNKISKTYLNRSKVCIKCYSGNYYIRDRETFAWTSWANIA